MKASDLIERIREDYLDDTLGVDTSDSLVSETSLVRFAQEAQYQACRRHELINDEVTPEVCEIPIVDGLREYKISDLITRIMIAKYDGVELCHTTEEDLYKRDVDWRFETGIPEAFYIKSRIIYFYPMPAGTPEPVKLSVVRIPLQKITRATDSFEVFPEAQDDLVYWMLYRVYNLRDEDLNDPTAAKMYLRMFEEVYGPVIPIDVRTHQLESPRNLTLTGDEGYPYTAQRQLEDDNFDNRGW